MQKRHFIRAEDGAMTIDWVALAAGLLLLSVGVVGLFTTEVQAVVDEIEQQLEVAASFDPNLTDSDEVASGNGLTPGESYETGVEGWTAGPGDYWADFNGDGVPNQGDLFIIDGNNDGSFDNANLDKEVDTVNGASDVVDIAGFDPSSGSYTDSDKAAFSDSGSDTFTVTQLQ